RRQRREEDLRQGEPGEGAEEGAVIALFRGGRHGAVPPLRMDRLAVSPKPARAPCVAATGRAGRRRRATDCARRGLAAYRRSSVRTIAGRYMLFDEIAHGGMATVHLGMLVGEGGFSRVVAVKRMHAHLARDPELVGTCLDEARLCARIRHPNVVPVL